MDKKITEREIEDLQDLITKCNHCVEILWNNGAPRDPLEEIESWITRKESDLGRMKIQIEQQDITY